jgi:hypothetical protein
MDISSLLNDPVLMYESYTHLYNLILLDYLNSTDIHQHAIEKLEWREEYIMENSEDWDYADLRIMKRRTGLIESEIVKGNEYISNAEFKSRQLATYTTPETIDQIRNDPQRLSIAELTQKMNQRTAIIDKAKEAVNQRPSIVQMAQEALELRRRIDAIKLNRTITPNYSDW